MTVETLRRWNRILIEYFRTHRRDLPFRRNRTPYRIWVSEVMLQQTRVEAMIPLYHNFLEKFPDLEALAGSTEGELLSSWRGLGYYNRARNMQKAARRILEERAGHFPSTYPELLELPGIGDYTASAIASLACGEEVPVLDGNVRRVVLRLLFDGDQVQRPEKEIRVFLERAIKLRPSDSSPGEWNEAMMEFGAMVCVPGRPDCDSCIANRICGAAKRGGRDLAAGIPPQKKEPRMNLSLIQGVWRFPGKRILLLEDDRSFFLKGSLLFPMKITGREGLLYRSPILFGTDFRGKILGHFRHTITRYSIQVEIREREWPEKLEIQSNRAGCRIGFYPESKLENILHASLARKVLKFLHPTGDLSRRKG